MRCLRPLPTPVVRSWILLILLGLSAPARGDEPASAPVEPMARPLLYVAVGPDATLFLVGTLHVPDTRVIAVPVLVDLAIGQADELWAEVDFSEDVRSMLFPYVRLPRNRNLRRMLGPGLVKRVEALLALHGQTLDGWERIKPWMLDTYVGELFAPKATRANTSLDQVLFARAKSLGKAVGGLESVYEQASVFDFLELKEQVALLEETVARLEADRREGTNSVETMILKYLSGSPEALLDEIKTYYDFDLKRDRLLYERMHKKRNARMLERLAEKAKAAADRTRIVVTGAAHLPDTGGLLDMLEKQGFMVWRVKTEADLPKDREAAIQRALREARSDGRGDVAKALEARLAARAETATAAASPLK